MILLIHSALKDALTIALVDQDNIVSCKNDSSRHPPVLDLIDQLLKENKLKLKDLTGLIAVTGPGAFSSLRTAITIINTFSFVLNIPVAGFKTDEFKNLTELAKKGAHQLEEVSKQKSSQAWLTPYYGREPSITF